MLRHKTNRHGFSFLEVLIAMVLVLAALATFGMVFPSGYHLNFKSYRHNKAVDLADAILHEVASKPFYSPPGDAAPGDSLNALRGWENVGDWLPDAFAAFTANNPTLTGEYHYALAPKGDPFPGIVVTFLSGGDPSILSDDPLVAITVNLSYSEPTHGAPVPRVIELTTYASYDK